VQTSRFTIIGVAPDTFAGTGLPPQSPDIWIPLMAQTVCCRAWTGCTIVLPASCKSGAPQGGVPVEQATANSRCLGRAWPPVREQQIYLSAKRATFFQTDSGDSKPLNDQPDHAGLR